MTARVSTSDSSMEDFTKVFWADHQKKADDAGVSLHEYMSQVEGEMLKSTMTKLHKHAQAHPKECPADCAFTASIQALKEQYRVA